MEAQNNPVKRQYNRKEVHTGDMEIGQKQDIDISLDAQLVRGESLVDEVGDIAKNKAFIEAMAFNEEPMTIRIEENSRSDFPETHVAVAVQGKGAEIFTNGQWLEVGWLPIGVPLVTKRKYVEVLARSKSDSIKTRHDDANVERPRNSIERRSSSNYPLSIIEDRNPKGHEWLSRILMGN